MGRLILFEFFAGVYYLSYIRGEWAEPRALEFLSNITITDHETWLNLYNSSIVVDNIICYYQYYFLTLYLPFFMQCLILFMPLISAAVLFLGGHLIGYVLAGYFASAAIFISALSSYYIWFLFPIYRERFLMMFGDGKRYIVFNSSPTRPGGFDVHFTHKLEN
jgi:hypothetical protein